MNVPIIPGLFLLRIRRLLSRFVRFPFNYSIVDTRFRTICFASLAVFFTTLAMLSLAHSVIYNVSQMLLENEDSAYLITLLISIFVFLLIFNVELKYFRRVIRGIPDKEFLDVMIDEGRLFSEFEKTLDATSKDTSLDEE